MKIKGLNFLDFQLWQFCLFVLIFVVVVWGMGRCWLVGHCFFFSIRNSVSCQTKLLIDLFFMSSFQHPQRHLIVQDILSICTYRNQASSGTPLKARHQEAKISFQKVSGFHFSVSQGLFQGPSRWLGDPQNGNLQF